jgi:glycosyltransferase involved in cell wall biosynthesis
MPEVSAIVPARNEEANIERAVRSLAAQPDIAEIIVVNDQSTDGTTAILEELADEFPQLRVLEAPSLPQGWVGKNHAVWLGAQQAKEDWLLFTDADTTHLPGSMSRALDDADHHEADLVSYSPDQEMQTWWERALIPFVYCRLARLFPYGEADDPNSPPAANGQYILIRREAYFAIGGHQAISAEIVEDVALARLARSAGRKIYFARGDGIARTRMYRSFGEMWAGWCKNLAPLVGVTSSWLGEAATVLVPPLVTLMFALGLISILSSWWYCLGAGIAGISVLHWGYAVELRRNRYPLSSILYYLPAVFLYSAALIASAIAHARGRVAWKGRKYPVGTK